MSITIQGVVDKRVDVFNYPFFDWKRFYASKTLLHDPVLPHAVAKEQIGLMNIIVNLFGLFSIKLYAL